MLRRMDEGKPFLALQQALVARLQAMSIREQSQYYREVLALRKASSTAESESDQEVIADISPISRCSRSGTPERDSSSWKCSAAYWVTCRLTCAQ